MVKSNVFPRSFQLIFSFSKREKTAFRQFLASPYHNRRTDIRDLAEIILRYEQAEKLPDRSSLWQTVYPGTAFDDQAWRLLLSYLARKAEQFLAVEATLEDGFEVKMRVAATLGRRSNNQ